MLMTTQDRPVSEAPTTRRSGVREGGYQEAPIEDDPRRVPAHPASDRRALSALSAEGWERTGRHWSEGPRHDRGSLLRSPWSTRRSHLEQFRELKEKATSV